VSEEGIWVAVHCYEDNLVHKTHTSIPWKLVAQGDHTIPLVRWVIASHCLQRLSFILGWYSFGIFGAQNGIGTRFAWTAWVVIIIPSMCHTDLAISDWHHVTLATDSIINQHALKEKMKTSKVRFLRSFPVRNVSQMYTSSSYFSIFTWTVKTTKNQQTARKYVVVVVVSVSHTGLFSLVLPWTNSDP